MGKAPFRLGLAFVAALVPVAWQTSVDEGAPDAAKELERAKTAEQARRETPPAAPVVRAIGGNPLTVNVGDDMSFQIFNASVPGSGQIYPSTCTSTADMGIFARIGTTLYAPNFSQHPCGSATSGLGVYTPWTPVSIGAVTGTGTGVDPFRVVVVSDAGASGLRLTSTITYVNGDNFFRKNLSFSSSTGPISFDVFCGADLYLANSDSGVPFLEPTSVSPGGKDCGTPPTYTILLIPLTPADSYSADGYFTVWSQIGAGSLPSTVAPGCRDNGAALQWRNRTVSPGTPTVIQTATSFGTIPEIAQFRLDSVTPNQGNRGQTLMVGVSGIGFQSSTTFDFGSGISVTSTTIDTSTHATLMISIDPGAALGFRNVVGTQSSGGLTSTLTNGFKVLDPSPFQDGTVLAGVGGDGRINVFNPAGTLLQTLYSGSTIFPTYTTGMCFDASRNMFGTLPNINQIAKYSSNGTLLTGNFGSGYNAYPESCVVDAAGNIYVGHADGTHHVRKLDPSGTLITEFSPIVGPRGTDWIDLASDQCTLFYTSEGDTIRRFNVCSNTQLADFVTGLSGEFCYALRIRPTSDVLVACYNAVHRVSSAGAVLQTYPASSFTPAPSTLFALNLDPDGTTFWTGDFGGNVYRVNIATGAQITHFDAGVIYPFMGGLAVVGEIVVSQPPSQPGSYFTLPPCRVIDTRNPAGPLGGPSLVGGNNRTFVLAGTCGIPPLASAVSVNIAEALPQGSGHLRIYPAGEPLPNVAAINFSTGQTRSNNAILTLGPAGDITVYAGIGAGLHVDFILDVNGYFQ